LRSKAISRTTKIGIYKTIIRPVVLCGSEARCLTANDEKNLCVWERKVLRKIFGPICVAGYWRSRTNEEVWHLYEEFDIFDPLTTDTVPYITKCCFGNRKCLNKTPLIHNLLILIYLHTTTTYIYIYIYIYIYTCEVDFH